MKSERKKQSDALYLAVAPKYCMLHLLTESCLKPQACIQFFVQFHITLSSGLAANVGDDVAVRRFCGTSAPSALLSMPWSCASYLLYGSCSAFLMKLGVVPSHQHPVRAGSCVSKLGINSERPIFAQSYPTTVVLQKLSAMHSPSSAILSHSRCCIRLFMNTRMGISFMLHQDISLTLSVFIVNLGCQKYIQL